MSNSGIRPGRWLYGLAAAFVVVGLALCVVSWVSLYSKVSKATESMQRFVVPGTGELVRSFELPAAGEYMIYYESRSVVDGQVYAGPKDPPSMMCRVVDLKTGQPMPLSPASGATYQIGGTEGKYLWEFQADHSGRYELQAALKGQDNSSPIVLAVGKPMMASVLKGAAGVFGGMCICPVFWVVALVIVIITFIKRRAAIRRNAAAAGA